jgi:hypothetical protein
MVERLTLAAGPATRLATRLATSLAAPLLLLAGCGSDNSVADPPPLSPPTSYPTHAPKRESPEHFIRRFYEAERRMENTGQTRQYRSMSARCKPCASLVARVRSIYRAGGYIHWGGLTLRSISETKSTAVGRTFSIRFDARPTRYKEAEGSPVNSLPGGPSVDLLTLTRHSRSWVVTARARSVS